MISTVELCVRNFVDHGVDREKAVDSRALQYSYSGSKCCDMDLSRRLNWSSFPQFLEVQDHIWGYGLMSADYLSHLQFGNMDG